MMCYVKYPRNTGKYPRNEKWYQKIIEVFYVYTMRFLMVKGVDSLRKSYENPLNINFIFI